MKEIVEADISVGHHGLSRAEAMTVRMALNALCVDMLVVGLGDDEHGKAIADACQKNAVSILKKIHANIEAKKEQPHDPR